MTQHYKEIIDGYVNVNQMKSKTTCPREACLSRYESVIMVYTVDFAGQKKSPGL